MKSIFVLSLSIFLLSACAPDVYEEIENGYAYASTNKYNTWIVKGDKPVVDSYITDYAIEKSHIIGYRKEPQKYDLDEKNISKDYGYFILNMENGTLVEGMSVSDMQRILRNINIDYDVSQLEL